MPTKRPGVVSSVDAAVLLALAMVMLPALSV